MDDWMGPAISRGFWMATAAGGAIVLAGLLAASLLRRWNAAVRLALRAAAAGGLLVLGVLAIFSIGLPLLIAGAMATGATVRTLGGPIVTVPSLSAVAAAVGAGVGGTGHASAYASHVVAANGVINSNGVVNSRDVAPADNGVLNADGVVA